jgi:hypothetical protein
LSGKVIVLLCSGILGFTNFNSTPGGRKRPLWGWSDPARA